MSLYEKTIAFILRHIDEKKLADGARLPTEPELAARAGVSMVTVRRALAELAARGIVRREQGRGTFLNRARADFETPYLCGLRNGVGLDSASSLETRLLGLERRAAAGEECKRLNIGVGAFVWEVARLLILNGRPMIHEISVVPAVLAPDLEVCLKQNPQRPPYATLESVYGLREVREERYVACRRANLRDRKLLRLPNTDWVVEISGVSYSARHVPIDSFQMVFDAKDFAFRLANAPSSDMAAIEFKR